MPRSSRLEAAHPANYVYPPMIPRLAALTIVLILSCAALRAQLPPPEEAVAPPAAQPPPPLAGRVQDGAYIAPGDAYQIAVPVLPELGGRITDNENIVTFEDDFNTHISVACFPLNLEQKWELDTRGLRDYLTYFFGNFVLTDFRERFPKVGVESAKFISSLMDGSLLVYALLPGGSFFEGKNVATGASADTPAVAKRGNLLFVKNGRIFVISSELAERVTQRRTYGKTTEQEDEILRQRLLDLAGRMEFPKPAPAPPK